MHSLLESPGNVLAFRITGTLTAEDVDAYKHLIDERIAADEVFGLVVDMSGFDDITADAMAEDLKYEASLAGKLHHFPKLALISDKQWINSLVKMAGRLVPGVEVKAFHPDDRTAALNFASNLSAGYDRPAMIIEIPCGLPKTLAFEIRGKITKPGIEPHAGKLSAAFDEHDQIDLLVRLADFTGYDPEILADKSLLELKRRALKHVRRYALVGAKPWMRAMIKLVKPFVRTEIRAFDPDEEDDAWIWLRS